MNSVDNMSAEEMRQYIELLESELEEVKKEKEAKDEEYKMLEAEYERIISEKDQELLKARGKIISQDITLASYRDKVGVPIIVEGEEHDLYKGEQKDYILNLLSSAIKGLPIYSRAYRICDSLLKANHEVGNRRRMQDAIASCLKNYSAMDKNTIDTLNEANIGVTRSNGGHYLMTLAGDDRYVVSISCTLSDSRCGQNTISDMNKNFF